MFVVRCSESSIFHLPVRISSDLIGLWQDRAKCLFEVVNFTQQSRSSLAKVFSLLDNFHCIETLLVFIQILSVHNLTSFVFVRKKTLKVMCFVMVPERLVDFQLLWHLFEILNKLNIGCFCRLFRLVLICLTHSQRSLNNVRGRDWKVGFIGAVLYNWRCPNLLNGTFSNGLSKTKNLLKAQFLPNAKISACDCYVNQASSKFFLLLLLLTFACKMRWIAHQKFDCCSCISDQAVLLLNVMILQQSSTWSYKCYCWVIHTVLDNW